MSAQFIAGCPQIGPFIISSTIIFESKLPCEPRSLEVETISFQGRNICLLASCLNANKDDIGLGWSGVKACRSRGLKFIVLCHVAVFFKFEDMQLGREGRSQGFPIIRARNVLP